MVTPVFKSGPAALPCITARLRNPARQARKGTLDLTPSCYEVYATCPCMGRSVRRERPGKHDEPRKRAHLHQVCRIRRNAS